MIDGKLLIEVLKQRISSHEKDADDFKEYEIKFDMEEIHLRLADECQAIIELVEEQPKIEKCGDCSRRKFYQKGYEDAKSKWIPCSERLPDTFEDTKSSDVVLVCGYDKEKDYHWKAMAFYVNTEALKRWFFAECKNTDKPIDWIDIVAWMPLPEDYKGD